MNHHATPTTPITPIASHPPAQTPRDPWRVLAWSALAGPAEDFIIEPGTRADLHALARFHYRAGAPATIDLVLRAIDRPTGILAGVLVVSRPTLNGPWRAPAWGAPFTTSNKRRAARALNRSVRCISRVIIDPRFRGLGLARELVRTYLARPLTPRTEAPAAMGRFANFFLAAGMRAVPSPPSRRDARLLAAMRRIGRPARVPGAPPPVLKGALAAWAAESRATRGLLASPIHWPTLAAHAARAVSPDRPTVYVWP